MYWWISKFVCLVICLSPWLFDLSCILIGTEHHKFWMSSLAWFLRFPVFFLWGPVCRIRTLLSLILRTRSSFYEVRLFVSVNNRNGFRSLCPFSVTTVLMILGRAVAIIVENHFRESVLFHLFGVIMNILINI